MLWGVAPGASSENRRVRALIIQRGSLAVWSQPRKDMTHPMSVAELTEEFTDAVRQRDQPAVRLHNYPHGRGCRA